METFSQLIYADPEDGHLLIHVSSTKDEPLYPHRGLMLDTSRHYISKEIIKTIFDGMSYLKLNVFHWHLVDDQSFPFVSQIYPELSEKGAYKPDMVYSPDTVQEVIEYARQRGIRVIPEFDTPGHTSSWGASHPELLCLANDVYGPMDPTKNLTYSFIRNLFREVKSVFQDDHFHLGTDEVDFDCWNSNPDIKAYMKNQGITDPKDLQAEFVTRVISDVEGMDAVPIVWEEALSEKLSKNAIVHVWKRTDEMGVMSNATKAGHRAILSTKWYLDRLEFGPQIDKFLVVNPRGFKGTKEQMKLVLGGEAAMWSELVDDQNVLQR